MSENVASQKKRWKVALRVFVASFVGVLVILATVAAGAVMWIQTSALDSAAIASDARVFLRDPALNKEVADFLTETAVDLGEQVKEESRDKALGRVLSQALTEEKISPLAETIAASDPVIESLASLVEQAHRQMLDIAKGESPEPVAVSLNVVPVVVSILDEMKIEKIIPESVKLPELADGATPEEDIAAFGKAFRMKLKDDFGQLMIVNKTVKSGTGTEQPAPQDGSGGSGDEGDKGMAYSDLDGKLADVSKGVTGVFVLLAALMAAVVFLAPTRRTGARIVAGAVFLGSVISAAAVRVAPSRLESSIDKESEAKVIRAILDAVLSSYVTLTTMMLLLSVVLVGASIWGPSWRQRLASRIGS